METLDEGVVMEPNGHELFFSYETNEEQSAISISLFSDGEELSTYADEEGVICAEDPEYKKISLIPYEEEGWIFVTVRIGKKEFDFCNFGEPEGYLYRTPFGKFVPLHEVENAHLFPEQFLNWCGALWNRTIPLLKKSALLGTGANTFLYAYPQDDYVYKRNRGGK